MVGQNQLFSEHRSLFRNPLSYGAAGRRVHRRSRPYQQPQLRSWCHKFFCLADLNASYVPSLRSAREALSTMGLGEKELTLPNGASAEELHALLLTSYPQLSSSGGYSFLRCMGKTKNLKVLEPPPGGHTPLSLSAMVGQSKVYVRPLQCDIPLVQHGRENQVIVKPNWCKSLLQRNLCRAHKRNA